MSAISIEYREFDEFAEDSEYRESQCLLIDNGDIDPETKLISTFPSKGTGELYDRDEMTSDFDDDLYISSESHVFNEDLDRK